MTPDQMAELAARLKQLSSDYAFMNAYPGAEAAMVNAADLIDSMAQRDLAWRDRFKAAVYDNLAAADNQDVPLEEYPDRILSVLDSFAPAGMAQRQCRGIPGRGCDYLAQCGSVCNKCGRVHDSQLDPTAEQRVPLTDEQVFADDGIMAANARIGIPLSEIMELARAIEKAHGIRHEDAA